MNLGELTYHRILGKKHLFLVMAAESVCNSVYLGELLDRKDKPRKQNALEHVKTMGKSYLDSIVTCSVFPYTLPFPLCCHPPLQIIGFSQMASCHCLLFVTVMLYTPLVFNGLIIWRTDRIWNISKTYWGKDRHVTVAMI